MPAGWVWRDGGDRRQQGQDPLIWSLGLVDNLCGLEKDRPGSHTHNLSHPGHYKSRSS